MVHASFFSFLPLPDFSTMAKAKTEWFESWFDSNYYPILYKHRNDKEAQSFIDKLFSYLECSSGARILDLACGRGRHSIYIHSKGYQVTGVDLSPSSIEFASRKAAEGLNFQVADMRYLPFEKDFDLVVNLFTSFGYFEHQNENNLVIQGVLKSLKNNGLFILDYLNAHTAIERLKSHETMSIDGVHFEINRTYQAPYIIKKIKVTDNDKKRDYVERVMALSEDYFQDLLIKNGFKVKAIFGDYLLKKFDRNSSDRLILVANAS